MQIAMIGFDFHKRVLPAPEGVGRWLARLLAERCGADVHYFVFAPTLQEDCVVEEPPLTVHKVACPGRIPFSLRQYFGPRRRMAEALRDLAPDIVHSQYADWGPCGLDAGLPTVVTVEYDAPGHRTRQGLSKRRTLLTQFGLDETNYAGPENMRDAGAIIRMADAVLNRFDRHAALSKALEMREQFGRFMRRVAQVLG